VTTLGHSPRNGKGWNGGSILRSSRPRLKDSDETVVAAASFSILFDRPSSGGSGLNRVDEPSEAVTRLLVNR
jgi:hypothetical protein